MPISDRTMAGDRSLLRWMAFVLGVVGLAWGCEGEIDGVGSGATGQDLTDVSAQEPSEPGDINQPEGASVWKMQAASEVIFPHQIIDVKVVGGLLSAQFDGSQPALPSLFLARDGQRSLNLDPKAFKKVKMRVFVGVEGPFTVTFSSGGSGYQARQNAKAGWNELLFDFSANPYWLKSIECFRLDFVPGQTEPYALKVDWVAFLP